MAIVKTPKPNPEPEVVEEVICGICEEPLNADETVNVCPDCGLETGPCCSVTVADTGEFICCADCDEENDSDEDDDEDLDDDDDDDDDLEIDVDDDEED